MRVYNRKDKTIRKPPLLTKDLERKLEEQKGKSCLRVNDGRIFCGGVALPKSAKIVGEF